MEQENTAALMKVLRDYAIPDPKIVGKLPKGGIQLDFVGHADITKILLEIDPHWRWVPIAWDNGRPAIHVENGMATMWGELTLLGQARLGVGSVRADKPELDKELVGDFLRNAAMRFGICLSLWTKQEWEDLGDKPSQRATPQHVAGNPSKGVQVDMPISDDDTLLTDEKKDQFAAACTKEGLNPMTVAKKAKVNLGKATVGDLTKLKAAFNEMKQAAQQAAERGE